MHYATYYALFYMITNDDAQPYLLLHTGTAWRKGWAQQWSEKMTVIKAVRETATACNIQPAAAALMYDALQQQQELSLYKVMQLIRSRGASTPTCDNYRAFVENPLSVVQQQVVAAAAPHATPGAQLPQQWVVVAAPLVGPLPQQLVPATASYATPGAQQPHVVAAGAPRAPPMARQHQAAAPRFPSADEQQVCVSACVCTCVRVCVRVCECE